MYNKLQYFINKLFFVLHMKEYGGLEFCPETITAHIVEIEAFTQTEVNGGETLVYLITTGERKIIVLLSVAF